ncbi:MAG: response regulator transcription factor [Rhodocyclaceae bacterium]|jgi:DNA-binding LytR/AlgR family response regulator|nr:response regulator transcription factor [Rhodocyclaceae bacterium]MCE2722487.1 LytTR family DNA-binding domain-containing protein [Betaproteobacteria bacterium]MCA3026426.1 response regulator transcription factor [Rhodocyclaceae bacterium]MCA3029261.1 response regulator transcription factor [Rhodocyclaceae bacterium]MCA3031381.1 response regulator transcription factor [Rhodocyclaceae bacterium]
MPITAMVAEDEQLLRTDLVNALAQVWPELVLVAEAEDGATALESIAAHKPDVAFLDIRMPGLTGLDVAAALADTSPCTQIVFVTAYDQYAIDAFKQGAVDYLMKPISNDRLVETVGRLKSRVGVGSNTLQVAELIRQLAGGAQLAAPRTPLTWITASAGRESRLIMVDDIACFQADNKYTVLMTAEGEALIKKPIKELIAELDEGQFKQVHRSTIVNLRAIKSIARDDTGRGLIKFKFGTGSVTVSQPFMHLFRNM